jgi:hypothetical protein
MCQRQLEIGDIAYMECCIPSVLQEPARGGRSPLKYENLSASVRNISIQRCETALQESLGKGGSRRNAITPCPAQRIGKSF